MGSYGYGHVEVDEGYVFIRIQDSKVCIQGLKLTNIVQVGEGASYTAIAFINQFLRQVVNSAGILPEFQVTPEFPEIKDTFFS